MREKERKLVELNSRIDALRKDISKRDTPLKEREKVFLRHLEETRFEDETAFITARLSEEARGKLAEESKALADEKVKLIDKEREITQKLDTQRRKALTKEPRETLTNDLEDLEKEQKELLREIGAIQEKLHSNEASKQRWRERTEAVEAQKRECVRWDRLHELIGSADGKKYRNFAQGLTFEIMIAHANRQLRRMSDRYLLIRDNEHPLELNVIDNYQAGVIRSTKNLSGGESFIVSLALALGLSQMASKNVQVDSLFLDEGFGTLDEESLETALETLGSLQQEGKLIGVISHVPALKERIGTQIQVTASTGGRSVLLGPGCTRIS